MLSGDHNGIAGPRLYMAYAGFQTQFGPERPLSKSTRSYKQNHSMGDRHYRWNEAMDRNPISREMEFREAYTSWPDSSVRSSMQKTAIGPHGASPPK